MVDLRSEIIALAEECLHSFIIKRMEVLQIGDDWRKGLVSFVQSQYRDHPENTEYLHSFLSDHTPDEVEIVNLDITAMVPLLLYYGELKKLYSSEDLKKKVMHAFTSSIYDFQEVRNLIRHRTERITESQRESFIIDQAFGVSCIIRFALLCEKYCKIGEVWKNILNRAFYLQGILRREKLFLLSEDKETDLSPESDLSEIEFMAESGNVSAQVLLGKMLYEGKRYGLDRDKAFLWFFKASRKNDKEAMYYLGQCYQSGRGVDFDFAKGMEWIQKSADLNYAPALYELANIKIITPDIDEKEKRDLAEMLIKASEQNYPPILRILGVYYVLGYGVEKDEKKGMELREKAAMLGDTIACEALAREALDLNDVESAKKWYTMGASYKSKISIKALEQFEKSGHF